MTIILAPIRYPLAAKSVKTLRYATELATENPDAELLVLHVDLYQTNGRAKRSEIARAIKPIVRGVDASLQLQSAFLVEEAIAEEATKVGADRIVVGKNQQSQWRRLLSRLFGNEPDITAHLREHTDATVNVVG